MRRLGPLGSRGGGSDKVLVSGSSGGGSVIFEIERDHRIGHLLGRNPTTGSYLERGKGIVSSK